MQIDETVIAVFTGHDEAENAVRKLAQAGFEMRQLSVVGKGYHTEEKVVGFYNTGDRVQFWGSRGAYWGGMWGLLLGGLFVTVPMVGPVVVLGYLAAAAISAVEGAALVGGLSALGAALYGLGIPRDQVIRYETTIKADGFLVMAHGTEVEMRRAKSILATLGGSQIESHQTTEHLEPAAILL